MGLVSGFGIGAYFAKVTMSQLSIPFITLGLGVDDIFVIMATLKKVAAKHPTATTPHILGLTLEKAGTSITVTTLTNVVVFLVGVCAQTPFMVHYCVIAAACIFMTYCYVVTFFMAILALDERRILDRRNFLVPCIRHEMKLKTFNEKGETEVNRVAKGLEWIYGHVLLTKVGRVICIVPAICLVVNCVPHLFDVKQMFDLRSFFIRNTSQHDFLVGKAEQYPQMGHQAYIFLGQLNYSAELPKMLALTESVNAQTDVAYHVESWVRPFEQFVRTYYDRNVRELPLSDQEFKIFLNRFLHSTDGIAYRLFFIFESPLTCAEPASDVKMSMIPFRYRSFNESLKYVPAMDRLAKVVDNGNLTSGFSSVWSKSYYYWIPSGVSEN
jgi:Niemann-Pick C1 protein